MVWHTKERLFGCGYFRKTYQSKNYLWTQNQITQDYPSWSLMPDGSQHETGPETKKLWAELWPQIHVSFFYKICHAWSWAEILHWDNMEFYIQFSVLNDEVTLRCHSVKYTLKYSFCTTWRTCNLQQYWNEGILYT